MSEGEPTSEHCNLCDKDKKAKLSGVYYNTTGYEREELRRRIAMAANQDEAILLWLVQYPTQSFIRDDLHTRVLPDAQNTSIGRTLNTLMRLGLVAKLSEKRMGNKDHQQHAWRLIRDGNEKR